MLERRAASLLEVSEHPNLVAANPREKASWEDLSEAAVSRRITLCLHTDGSGQNVG